MATAMAAPVAAAPLPHWLFNTQNYFVEKFDILTKGVYKVAALRVQLFIIHEDRILLLQPQGREIEDAWTAPSSTVPFNNTPKGSQKIFKIAIRMLRHAIEERALLDLQFPDLASDNNYAFEQWKTERFGVGVTKFIPMSVIVTVGSSVALEDMCAINYPEQYSGKKWFTLEEAVKRRLTDLPVSRLTAAFAQLKK